MKNNLFLAILFSSIILNGCQSSSEVDETRQQVLELHDDSMTKMNQIHLLIGQLEEQKDTTSTDTTEVVALIKQLEIADQQMMDWMHKFKHPADSLEDKVKIDFYKKENDKMTDVDNTMNEAIEKAKVFLKLRD